MSALAAVDRWLTAPVPGRRYEVLRLLLAGFAAVYLTLRLPAFWAIGDQAATAFEPLGVLSVLGAPPPGPLGRAIPLVALVASLAALSGRAWRAVGPLWAVSLLVLATWRSSWGQVIHHEHLLVLHAAVLAAAPAGRSVAAGALEADRASGWHLRLMALLTVATYVLAGVAKLRLGGTDWLSGEILRNHIASNALRLELLGAPGSPVAGEIASLPLLLSVAAPAAVLLELATPLLLIGGRVRNVGAALVWAMHVAIGVAMWVGFPYHVVPLALAPFFAVERPVDELLSRLRR